MITQKQIIVVIALVVGITLAVPATAMENGISISAAPINPNFLEYQKTTGEYVLASSETGDMHPPGLTPSPLDLSHIRASESRSASMLMQEVLPEVYDLRSQGQVTPVKNQGRSGSCWTFSAIASLESSLLPGETRDFSENHMKNLCSRNYPEGFDRDAGDGGNYNMATAYLARWTGPVDEEDDPYDGGSGVSPTDLAPEMHVQNVLFLPNLKSRNEVIVLKRAIMEHGAVYTDILMDNSNHSYYNPETSSYYCHDMGVCDHAVTIVGWNDTYDRNLFATTPTLDGAWIIKNSWGTQFGDGGYFYLSYCDVPMKESMNIVFLAEDPGNYDNIYQYDPLGQVGGFGTGNDTGLFTAIFTVDNDEEIRAVSLYAEQCDSPYELDIYLDPAIDPINTSGPAASQAGMVTDAGYRTIPLENPVNLSAGQKFSIVMRLTTPGYDYPIPVEYPVSGYSSKATAGPGEGYVYRNGEWVDLIDFIKGYEDVSPCLKAFTVVHKDPPSITGIVPDRGYQNQTVQVTNLSGAGFCDGATVRLTWAGQPDITATGVSVVSPSQITCTFNLTGCAAGPRDVFVENPDGQTAVLQQGFTIDARVPVVLTANKDVVVRGNGFVVVITGEAEKDYRIFVENASGVAPESYPVVTPGQAGIHSYSPTDVIVTTDATGTCYVQFETNQSTTDTWFTIRAEDPADTGAFDEVRVQVVQGDVTIVAAGSGVYPIGEEILLSGTNTGSVVTYLFATGPGLAASGSRLDDLAVASITRDAGTFTRVDVESDDTWAYRWDTGACGLLSGCGNYTIYAVMQPNAKCDLADTAYGTTTVTLRDELAAKFTVNVTEGNTPLTVQFTDESTGNVTSWLWDFGDGKTSTVQSPIHTYESAGRYIVSLNASNAYGYNLSSPATITVLDPPAAVFTADPTGGNAPLTVQFTDRSTGNVTAWLWDFGDGNTSTVQNPAHTYESAGRYTVSLNASNAYGHSTSTSTTITVLDPPAAGFTVDPTEGNTPLTVQFTDRSAGNVTAWLWDFGDGNTSTVQNPAHTYESAGRYNVSLNASNAYGYNLSSPATITVLDPLATNFTANVTAGVAPLAVQFTDNSAGSPTAWNWSFGDGNTSGDCSPD